MNIKIYSLIILSLKLQSLHEEHIINAFSGEDTHILSSSNTMTSFQTDIRLLVLPSYDFFALKTVKRTLYSINCSIQSLNIGSINSPFYFRSVDLFNSKLDFIIHDFESIIQRQNAEDSREVI